MWKLPRFVHRYAGFQTQGDMPCGIQRNQIVIIGPLLIDRRKHGFRIKVFCFGGARSLTVKKTREF